MTGKEMERAIEILLSNQASFETQLEQTNRQLGTLADTQNDFTQAVTRHIESQNQINASLRDGQARTDAALQRLADAQAHTDGRLDALIDIVRGGRNGDS
jgi:septal ring factor EnvC (AmiA/AmiB activator)